MKLKNVFTFSALVLAMTTTGAQAAELNNLPTVGNSGAIFAGGATINGGASFLTEVPAGQPINFVGSITPASKDVGAQADVMIIAAVKGGGFFQYTQSGFLPLDIDLSSASLGITPYQSVNLSADESIDITIDDLATALAVDLTGNDKVRVMLAYATEGGPIRYAKASKFSVAEAPSASCPVGTAKQDAVVVGGKDICVLSGTYTQSLKLTNNFDYRIEGTVRIGEDNTVSPVLTIDPGVTTYGTSGNDFIWIDRGAKIMANGTKANPIIMTSATDLDATATTRGEWGGLVINGNAPINGCSVGTVFCEAAGEGNSGLFGGNDAEDSSGSLTYLVVKYAGFLINDLDELNGIAFQGVGSGTNVDYIQIHNNQDDGIEFFGGTVNAKHLYLTGNRDDSLDWTKGWTGKVQHVVIQQGADTGDQGFEMDNNGSAPDSEPRAKPVISNVTVIGNDNTDIGLLIREGTGGNFYNFVITGMGDGCIDIDTTETFTAAGTPDSLSGILTMNNSVVDCATNFVEDTDEPYTVDSWFSAQDGNTELLTGMTDYINTSTVNDIQNFSAESLGEFFDEVDYVGAVPSAENDWTEGWTFRPL